MDSCNACQCVCHTGHTIAGEVDGEPARLPIPHPYGDCCPHVNGVYPRTVLLQRYDVAELPADWTLPVQASDKAHGKPAGVPRGRPA